MARLLLQTIINCRRDLELLVIPCLHVFQKVETEDFSQQQVINPGGSFNHVDGCRGMFMTNLNGFS
jgi:hypothetical protein